MRRRRWDLLQQNNTFEVSFVETFAEKIQQRYKVILLVLIILNADKVYYK